MDQTYEDGATVTIHGPLGAGPMTDEHVRRQVGAVLDGIGDRRTDDRAGDPLALAAVPGEGRFVRDFLTAPELVRVAERLIDGCPELEHLAGVPIRWFWKKKGPKSGDKGAYGKCLKAGGLIAALANTDFYAWLAADLCRDAGITNRQLEALVFHELLHLERREDKDGNETYELRGHDFAGFAPELSRYGAWTHELGEARDAFAQLGLDLGAGR